MVYDKTYTPRSPTPDEEHSTGRLAAIAGTGFALTGAAVLGVNAWVNGGSAPAPEQHTQSPHTTTHNPESATIVAASDRPQAQEPAPNTSTDSEGMSTERAVNTCGAVDLASGIALAAAGAHKMWSANRRRRGQPAAETPSGPRRE